jgi:hypothetical protein
VEGGSWHPNVAWLKPTTISTRPVITKRLIAGVEEFPAAGRRAPTLVATGATASRGVGSGPQACLGRFDRCGSACRSCGRGTARRYRSDVGAAAARSTARSALSTDHPFPATSHALNTGGGVWNGGGRCVAESAGLTCQFLVLTPKRRTENGISVVGYPTVASPDPVAG